jgi:hypothetical protein
VRIFFIIDRCTTPRMDAAAMSSAQIAEAVKGPRLWAAMPVKDACHHCRRDDCVAGVELASARPKPAPSDYSRSGCGVSNVADALMFLGRVQSARALYLKYRGEKDVQGHNSWGTAILNDFEEIRKAGLTHLLMDEIERLFRAGG